MPKFKDSEKILILARLKEQGERLFSLYGIKKVTVDDLVKATGIAKGSFYGFYVNKEHLYIDIVGDLQNKLWQESQQFLNEHRGLAPVQLTKQFILAMFQGIRRYPLLSLAKGEMTEYLYMKLPPEALQAHSADDSHHLLMLAEYGINFKCGIELATQVLQTLTVSFLDLPADEDQTAVWEIILDGVLKELIDDRNNQS